MKEVTVVNFNRELAKPDVKIGDQNYLLSFYENLEEPYCDVHTTEQDPNVSDEPIVTDDPSISDPPPYYTDPFISNPPMPTDYVPTLPPVEPTDNPFVDPFITNPPLPSDDQGYIPVVDPDQDGWW